jgi:DNA-binding PadR family transcriptional regulator
MQRQTPTLDYAILGLVARSPSTGYEVSARLRNPVGYYWAESHGGVYPSLRRLVEAGWVSVRSAPGPGPHGKKVYSVTRAGRRALGRWAASPPADAPPRDELVLKTSSLWAADRDAAVGMLVAEGDRWERARKEYAGIVAELRAAEPVVGSARWFGLQTALRGVGFARGRRDWCRQVARQLNRSQEVTNSTRRA